MSRKIPPVLLWMSMVLPSVMAQEVSFRQVDAENYVVRLTNKTSLTEPVAQSYVARAAKSLCKEREPRLGKYDFNSTEFLGNETPTRAPVSFVFTQEVACVAASPVLVPAPAPVQVSSEEKAKAAADVLDKAEQYFRLLGAAKIDDAFQDVDSGGGMSDETTWKRNKREFRELAGELQRIAITKVTVYVNPTGAQQPGLYVATDYRNVWRNVPVQCGYLMWFRTPSGEFRITREETGHITAEQLKSMPAAQQQAIDQALRCR